MGHWWMRYNNILVFRTSRSNYETHLFIYISDIVNRIYMRYGIKSIGWIEAPRTLSGQNQIQQFTFNIKATLQVILYKK